MSINKSISYILCNKGIIVNLNKLYFPSFHFSLQPNKRVFHTLTFPPLQPNTQEGKLNIFYLLTIFHPPTFPLLHPNGSLEFRFQLLYRVNYIFNHYVKMHFWSLYFGPILILVPKIYFAINVVSKKRKSILFWFLQSID